MKLKRRRGFKFGKSKLKLGRIHIRRTHSNIFLTFTDLVNNVIISRSSGSSGIIGLKRRKKAPYALENLVKALIPFLKLYKIKRVQIVFKMRIDNYWNHLYKELNYYGLHVSGFFIRRPIAFNGVKQRKLRRL